MHNEDRGSSNATVLPQQGAKPRAQKTINGVQWGAVGPKNGQTPPGEFLDFAAKCGKNGKNFWILPRCCKTQEKKRRWGIWVGARHECFDLRGYFFRVGAPKCG